MNKEKMITSILFNFLIESGNRILQSYFTCKIRLSADVLSSINDE